MTKDDKPEGKIPVSTAVHPKQISDIDVAAYLSGKNRSEFIRDASVGDAKKIIQDAKRNDPGELQKAREYVAGKGAVS